jgi:hypothetical protein
MSERDRGERGEEQGMLKRYQAARNRFCKLQNKNMTDGARLEYGAMGRQRWCEHKVGVERENSQKCPKPKGQLYRANWAKATCPNAKTRSARPKRGRGMYQVNHSVDKHTTPRASLGYRHTMLPSGARCILEIGDSNTKGKQANLAIKTVSGKEPRTTQ